MKVVSALPYQCFDSNYIAVATAIQNVTSWLQLKCLLITSLVTSLVAILKQ